MQPVFNEPHSHGKIVIVILLLGPSPTGNATFISHLLPSNTSPEPIPTPPPPTTAIASYAADLPNGQCVLLLDTPGFDPSAPFSTRWGVEVVTYISALHARNKSRVCWGGILYFASVEEGTMTPGSMQGVCVVERLCGADMFASVRVVTTGWAAQHPDGRQVKLEHNLQANED
ncbi:uncharacterized protein CC84DRAFT_1216357 [Paraphaeosphaeria sporulosa]|uniref:G domain-containing protein n=1 Tax=Paraphaeosphaeria sporulosa TaxID=1460663 RepID=A0A177CKI8_9PLEO|nr:uncharacterized protein CC84DRAFT_1216357 [Paraphaeosphaeria sporulosa]OAG07388.1 hypothetical protein CC84DRAFT_1216357 [Paraphaeosphaeria sporulosa]